MHDLTKENKWKAGVFLAVNLGLYLAFMGFSLPKENVFYFLTVLFSFLFTWLIKDFSFDAWFLRIALFFTVLADILLVLLDDYYTLALVFFIGTQSAYLTRLFVVKDKKGKTIQLISQGGLVLTVIIIAVLLFKENTAPDVVLAGGYFALLVSNIIFAFLSRKNNPLFWIGLLLFSFCDIFVGLSALTRYADLNPDSLISKINAIPFNFIWFFYTPSQTILALTIFFKKKSCSTREDGLESNSKGI